MQDSDVRKLVDRLCDTKADVVYFPVRHHSPAAAMLVGQLIDSLKPAAVLIEGPSDYNEHFDELLLDHQLPIAIYSYFRSADTGSTENHRGVYYPFCEYSPEWAAINRGHQARSALRFIDLPWSSVADTDRSTHRYTDAKLRRGRYVRALCERLQVEDFDDLWDRIIESHQDITLADYLNRAHSLCLNIRQWEQNISASDRQREAFMTKQIDIAWREFQGPILVVTGGFHSGALAARSEGFACAGIDDTDVPEPVAIEAANRGIVLTTYSYDQLDSLTGYDAGMPNPGFYEHAWRQRQAGEVFNHQPLLLRLVEALRERNQILSTADLIAVETSAQALAALRGRQHVWRRDLIDAVTSSLIKDELEYGCESPFVDAVHAVLRGKRRGQLAEGARVPPLVSDIRQQLEMLELQLERSIRSVEFDLLEQDDLCKSRLLHQLQTLEIDGFRCDGGTDFLVRNDLERLWESWTLGWTPDFESSCIEASRYGTTLRNAVTARLLEEADAQQSDAASAAALLVKAAQSGVDTLSPALLDSLERMIAAEPRFDRASMALEHLLFLFCFDEAFGTTRLLRLTDIVHEAFSRSLWLLELLGQTALNDGTLLRGMKSILETYQRVGDVLEVNDSDFGSVLLRVQADSHKPPHVRGGAAGMLWTIGQTNADTVLGDLMYFADPDHLGDFLTGLFSLAREVAQRHPQLVRTIDDVLLQFGADQFQTALPSLRLAFTSFTPREKHHMLSTLFESLGLRNVEPLIQLAVDDSAVVEALAIEERLFEAVRHYGLEESYD